MNIEVGKIYKDLDLACECLAVVTSLESSGNKEYQKRVLVTYTFITVPGGLKADGERYSRSLSDFNEGFQELSEYNEHK